MIHAMTLRADCRNFVAVTVQCVELLHGARHSLYTFHSLLGLLESKILLYQIATSLDSSPKITLRTSTRKTCQTSGL